MADYYDDKPRNVIPNWRSYSDTLNLSELDSVKTSKKKLVKYNLSEYINDFKQNKSTVYASELISAGVSNNQTLIAEVKEAAKFLLDAGESVNESQLKIANKIYNNQSIYEAPQVNTILPLTQFSEKNYHADIRMFKNLIKVNPYNAIPYVELSRCYATLGISDKSISAMKVALHLAPGNRFVLRSATRLFAHYDSPQEDHLSYVHYYLKKYARASKDPWILSAEISTANVLEKTSKNIKQAIELIDAKKYTPDSITELASSIGTIEFSHGSNKKAKKKFQTSLLSPNDNSLAQAEWISNYMSLDVDQSAYSSKKNFEAMALDLYYDDKYEDALDYTVKWFMDQPYSTRSVTHASRLISPLKGKNEKTDTLIQLLASGLISHPNEPIIINNLAYALALNGEPMKAMEYINNHKHHKMDSIQRTCFKATEGLAQFRLDKPDIGRKLYQEAISDAKKDDEKVLNWKAILNLAREEFLAGSNESAYMMEIVEKIPDTELEVKNLKKEIIDLYNPNEK